MRWIRWPSALAFAFASLFLLVASTLPDRGRWALANVVIVVGLALACRAIYRACHGNRGWQRSLRAWATRPVTHWNDWRVIGLLAGNAFGFYFLGAVDLPDTDRWTSASVLLLLTVCLAVQMISVAFFKRGRK